MSALETIALTPEEVRFLISRPPYAYDYADIICKYFGDKAPEHIRDFITDVLEFKRNKLAVKRNREKETNEDEEEPSKKKRKIVCAQCTQNNSI